MPAPSPTRVSRLGRSGGVGVGQGDGGGSAILLLPCPEGRLVSYHTVVHTQTDCSHDAFISYERSVLFIEEKGISGSLLSTHNAHTHTTHAKARQALFLGSGSSVTTESRPTVHPRSRVSVFT